jgi:hypothetical protein
VSHECKLGCEYPPFAGKRQIATRHFFERDIFAGTDLGDVLSKPATQRSLAFGRAL